MEIFDVLSINRIENYPAAGEFFLENFILEVSQTHFSKDFYRKGRHTFSKGGAMPPPPLGGGGAVKYPDPLLLLLPSYHYRVGPGNFLDRYCNVRCKQLWKLTAYCHRDVQPIAFFSTSPSIRLDTRLNADFSYQERKKNSSELLFLCQNTLHLQILLPFVKNMP